MTIDTLAYAKELEAAGVVRRAAEAHTEALTKHFLPDLATKAALESTIDRLENRLRTAIEQTAHQQTVRVLGMMLTIVGVMNAILFAMLRVVH